MSEQSQDNELAAITSIMSALQPLDEVSRKRVLAYVQDRLSIVLQAPSRDRGITQQFTRQGTSIDEHLPLPDIRALKEAKVPESAVEMAVLVAYYLSELAPDEERKVSINSTDLSKYFKQGKFPLPRSMKDVLPHAKSSGFMESISFGEYKLTSVGYNLAVHGLPRTRSQ